MAEAKESPTVSIPEATEPAESSEPAKAPNHKKQRNINRLRHSKKCFDELCGKDRFDEIRINEIKFTMHDVEKILLEE